MLVRDRKVIDVPLFAGLTATESRLVRRLGTELEIPSGTQLAREGTPEQQFVVVLRGHATTEHPLAGTDELGPGTWFGASSILPGGRSATTVVASGPMRVMVFDVRSFRTLLDRVPSVARRLLGETLVRLEGRPRLRFDPYAVLP